MNLGGRASGEGLGRAEVGDTVIMTYYVRKSLFNKRESKIK